MKILHCCLGNFYIDNYGYQENILPKVNKEDGHDVLILASTETYTSDHTLDYVSPSEYTNEYGITVKRIAYRNLLLPFLQRKIRAYVGVYRIIEAFMPDVILFHSPCSFELLTVAKYKKRNPHIKLYVDSHGDYYNSARNFISKNVLHKIFYKNILHKTLPQINRLFYISEDTKDFLTNMYKVKEDILEFYPLGGIIPTEDEWRVARARIRAELNIGNDEIVLVHTGKLGKQKRTEDILNALALIDSPKLRLMIIGTISDELKDIIKPLINADERVLFLGWKSSDKLANYFCASDMYIQPGTQSATMLAALCCGCPVMLYPYKSHKAYIVNNGYFIESISDIIACIKEIDLNPEVLKEMSKYSTKIAKSLLDYKKLAARLYI